MGTKDICPIHWLAFCYYIWLYPLSHWIYICECRLVIPARLPPIISTVRLCGHGKCFTCPLDACSRCMSCEHSCKTLTANFCLSFTDHSHQCLTARRAVSVITWCGQAFKHSDRSHNWYITSFNQGFQVSWQISQLTHHKLQSCRNEV